MKKIAVIILLTICFIENTLIAAFYEEIDAGARSQAMAGAFEAETRDVSGVFYNPASIAGLRKAEIFSAYEGMYLGLSDESVLRKGAFAAGIPLKIKQKNLGILGINYRSFGFSNLYGETIVGLIHGFHVKKNLLFGLNLKILKVSYGKTIYTEVNPVFEKGYGTSAFSQDIGIIYRFNNLNWGVAILNVSQPDVGLKHENKVKRNIRTGVSIRSNRLNLNFSATFFKTSARIRTGVETWIFGKSLFLRGGINFGNWNYRNISLGFGYNKDMYRIDYSWKYPLSGINGILGSHQLSFNYRFGMAEAEIKKVSGKKPIPAYLIESEISAWENSWASDLVEEAKEHIKRGLYKQAFEKYRKADELLKRNKEVKKQKEKLKGIIKFFPKVKGKGKKPVLLRKGINAYLKSDPDTALNNLIYANYLWPEDKNIEEILTVVKETFPNIFARMKGFMGVNMVEQKLEQSLEMIYTGRYSESVLKCKEVLELEPDNITALTRMGSAYWVMGKKGKAYKLWKRVLELDPGNEQVIKQIGEYKKELRQK